MSQLLDQLRKVVGENNVVSGEAIHADYTHDETLGADPVVPLALVLPGSTGEVSEVLKLASEHGVAVIARGSGTGLSGAAIPLPDGILLAFDRMKRIREIDTENQVAVVEPGVTLEQLNGELAKVGLIYPVSPGEQSGSLGGNVATNAGGMRAVRYGVTRHHVLGLEAVLADGTVLRTGGKFVKSSNGYDLTQLLIGSEGTLAITTEVTVKVAPRFTESATVLAPFATLAEVAQAVPHIVNSGINPSILEYVDVIVMGGITRAAGLDLGVPRGRPGAHPRLSRCRVGGDGSWPSRRGRRAPRHPARSAARTRRLRTARDIGIPADRCTRTGLLRGEGGRAATTSSTPSCRGRPSPATWPRWPSWPRSTVRS